MAESCNLFLSPSDRNGIEASRETGTWADARRPEVLRLIESANPYVAAKLAKILRSPAHPCNPKLMEQLLSNVVGNESVPGNYTRALPGAVAQILEITPDALGLVQAVSKWGPRATSAAQNLTHHTRGAGFAYELLGTAAIINQTSRARDAPVDLRIYPGDRIDFGVKLQARYAHVSHEDLPSHPSRATVEADLLIRRDNRDSLESRTIAVDFKHTLTGTYSGRISQDQLAGVSIAILTGEIDEFHFVSNGAFGGAAIGAIQEANAELRKAGHNATVYYHEYVQHHDA